jgi:hypothetical protein
MSVRRAKISPTNDRGRDIRIRLLRGRRADDSA